MKALLLAIVLAAGLALGGSAAAATPTREVFVDQGFFSLGTIDCGAGVVLEERMISERVEVISFFDRLGDPVAVQVHVRFLGELTNLATGESHIDRATFTEIHDLVSGEISFVGPSYRFVEAGSGPVFLEIGNKVVDDEGNVVFDAGPDQFTQGGLDALCAALG